VSEYIYIALNVQYLWCTVQDAI